MRFKLRNYKTRIIVLFTLLTFIFICGGFDSHAKSEESDTNLQTVNADYLNESLQITKDEIGVLSFVKRTGLDGCSTTIAVIDTGIDVAHPDLRKTTLGTSKVIDWVDFTDEGRVETNNRAKRTGNEINTTRGKVKVGNIKSKSGIYHYGYLHEKQLDEHGYIEQDLNRNGSNKDSYLVLLTDSNISGFYDTVYVDTENSGDLSKVEHMKIYSESKDVGYFGGKSSFVIAHIEHDGSYVKLGFDGNGHGTHVAGIIGANGELSGVAPGAQLMSLKAIGSSGDGTWDNISNAMEYAASMGADVINISIGSVFNSGTDIDVLTQKVNYLASKYNTIFVFAAGNDGPGISSNISPTNIDAAIVVGAYISPEIWKLNYDRNVQEEGLWYFSAAGPSFDGSLTPNVIAPGSVVSTVNIWDSGGYYLLDGTSMATPYVSGVAALLIDQGRREGVEYDYRRIKKALEMGARTIKGYSTVEQGYGLIDINKSSSHLRNLSILPKLSVSAYNPITERGRGIYYRDAIPEEVFVSVTNMTENEPISLKLKSKATWLKLDDEEIILPKGKNKDIKLNFDIPKEPGLYSTLLTGDDSSTYGTDLELPITIINPIRFNMRNGYIYKKTDKLKPSKWNRYFFMIPPNMKQFRVKVNVLDMVDNLGCEPTIHIINPKGREVRQTENSDEIIIQEPAEGVWEAVVYCEPHLADFGIESSKYTITIQPEGVFWNEVSLDIVIPEGENIKSVHQEIRMTNLYKDFNSRLYGMGFSDTKKHIKKESFGVSDGKVTIGPFIDIAPGTFKLSLHLEGYKDPGTGIDIYLYRFNIGTQKWEEISNTTANSEGEDSLEIFYPKPGRYIVYFSGYKVPRGKTEIQLVEQVFLDTEMIKLADSELFIRKGETIWVPIDLNMPSTTGKYIGYFMVEDFETKEIISALPIRTFINQRELVVALTSVKVVPGKEINVDISVKDKKTKNPLNTVINVNGKMMELKRGKGILRLPYNEKGYPINIDIDLKGYAPYNKTVILENP